MANHQREPLTIRIERLSDNSLVSYFVFMNVALFGAGRIGKIHAANLARQPGISLKYVVDISPDATAELARQYGAQAAVSESVLGDSSVKAVVIASSTDTHADLIIRSAAAGKAIFCEKPVDLDLDRARKCADVCREGGCHLHDRI